MTVCRQSQASVSAQEQETVMEAAIGTIFSMIPKYPLTLTISKSRSRIVDTELL